MEKYKPPVGVFIWKNWWSMTSFQHVLICIIFATFCTIRTSASSAISPPSAFQPFYNPSFPRHHLPLTRLTSYLHLCLYPPLSFLISFPNGFRRPRLRCLQHHPVLLCVQCKSRVSNFHLSTIVSVSSILQTPRFLTFISLLYT